MQQLKVYYPHKLENSHTEIYKTGDHYDDGIITGFMVRKEGVVINIGVENSNNNVVEMLEHKEKLISGMPYELITYFVTTATLKEK